MSDLDLDALALSACLVARAAVAAGGPRLRQIHEAGRLLGEIRRTPGLRTSSNCLTRLQGTIRAANISRQTANTWQLVGAVPVHSLEAFITEAAEKSQEITIASFLAAWTPKARATGTHTIKIAHLSDAARQRFLYQVELLGSTVCHTTTPGETIVDIVDRLYAHVLLQRVSS